MLRLWVLLHANLIWKRLLHPNNKRSNYLLGNCSAEARNISMWCVPMSMLLQHLCRRWGFPIIILRKHIGSKNIMQLSSKNISFHLRKMQHLCVNNVSPPVTLKTESNQISTMLTSAAELLESYVNLLIRNCLCDFVVLEYSCLLRRGAFSDEFKF